MTDIAGERSTDLDAPIVAVTVYPDRARVTRRSSVQLEAGERRVRIGPLPLGLHRDSLRVGGRGAATVLGVDVVTEHRARAADEPVAELEKQRRARQDELAELGDADRVQDSVAAFLRQLTERAGRTYARALATGGTDPSGVATFSASIADQLGAVYARQRDRQPQRTLVQDRLAAIERQLAELGRAREPDRPFAEISLDVHAPTAEVQLELSYVVGDAGWRSTYDIRLDAETLTLTWFGLVSQRTGEDWPECELVLSTARPSAAAKIPELDPWFLDRSLPVSDQRMAFAGGPPPGAAAMRAAAMADDGLRAVPLLAQSVASVEQGVAAATYRPARPVAVPADGGSHRAVVAVLELPAALDYITAPVRAPEAHLRATVTNSSPHTLLPGRASVFHGGDFVGASELTTWAPGEEVELALGVDDRIRVERKLVRRAATKAALTATRRRDVEYRTAVANHTPRPARITVLDQLPVSRDEGITVREAVAEPAPNERGDLGELIWRLQVAPGESRDVVFGLRVELAKGVELAGWRE